CRTSHGIHPPPPASNRRTRSGSRGVASSLCVSREAAGDNRRRPPLAATTPTMPSTPFTHWFPQQQVLFGRGIASDLRAPLARLGLARPLVVCSARAAASPQVEAIAARLPGAVR